MAERYYGRYVACYYRWWRIGLFIAGSLAIGCIEAHGSNADTSIRKEKVVIASIKMVVPASLVVRRLATRCGRSGPDVVITNQRVGIRRESPPNPRSCTNGWDMTKANRKYVFLDIGRFRYPPGVVNKKRSGLPVKLTTDIPSSNQCGCTFRYANLIVGRDGYEIREWIGKAASKRERSDIKSIIASVAPRR